jgi:hypothetical protein
MAKELSYKDPSFDLLEAGLEREYKLPRGLMSAIRTRGEKSNNNQVSPKGATGVYQFMPKTFLAYADPGTKATDPEAAAVAAARYLADASKWYGGDIGAMAAEYNGGPKAAKRYLATKKTTGVGDPGNDETRGYVTRVLAGMSGSKPEYQASTIPRSTPSTTQVERPTQQDVTPWNAVKASSPLGTDIYALDDDMLGVSGGWSDNMDVGLETNLLGSSDLTSVGASDESKIAMLVDEVLNGSV